MIRTIVVSAKLAKSLRAKADRVTPARVNSASASGGKPKAKHKTNQERSEDLTAQLIAHLTALGCPEPEREYRFRGDRAWRFDLVWERFGVAAEIEGGVHVGGRHTRGDGFEKDAIKYAAATADGWSVLRVTPQMIRRKSAATFIAETLRISGAKDIPKQMMPWQDAEEA